MSSFEDGDALVASPSATSGSVVGDNKVMVIDATSLTAVDIDKVEIGDEYPFIGTGLCADLSPNEVEDKMFGPIQPPLPISSSPSSPTSMDEDPLPTYAPVAIGNSASEWDDDLKPSSPSTPTTCDNPFPDDMEDVLTFADDIISCDDQHSSFIPMNHVVLGVVRASGVYGDPLPTVVPFPIGTVNRGSEKCNTISELREDVPVLPLLPISPSPSKPVSIDDDPSLTMDAPGSLSPCGTAVNKSSENCDTSAEVLGDNSVEPPSPISPSPSIHASVVVDPLPTDTFVASGSLSPIATVSRPSESSDSIYEWDSCLVPSIPESPLFDMEEVSIFEADTNSWDDQHSSDDEDPLPTGARAALGAVWTTSEDEDPLPTAMHVAIGDSVNERKGALQTSVLLTLTPTTCENPLPADMESVSPFLADGAVSWNDQPSFISLPSTFTSNEANVNPLPADMINGPNFSAEKIVPLDDRLHANLDEFHLPAEVTETMVVVSQQLEDDGVEPPRPVLLTSISTSKCEDSLPNSNEEIMPSDILTATTSVGGDGDSLDQFVLSHLDDDPLPTDLEEVIATDSVGYVGDTSDYGEDDKPNNILAVTTYLGVDDGNPVPQLSLVAVSSPLTLVDVDENPISSADEEAIIAGSIKTEADQTCDCWTDQFPVSSVTPVSVDEAPLPSDWDEVIVDDPLCLDTLKSSSANMKTIFGDKNSVQPASLIGDSYSTLATLDGDPLPVCKARVDDVGLGISCCHCIMSPFRSPLKTEDNSDESPSITPANSSTSVCNAGLNWITSISASMESEVDLSARKEEEPLYDNNVVSFPFSLVDEQHGCAGVDEQHGCAGLDEQHGCAGIEEQHGCAGLEEQHGCAGLDEQHGCAGLEEQHGCAGIDEQHGCAGIEEQHGCAGLEEQHGCAGLDEQRGCAGLDEQCGCAGLDEQRGCAGVEVVNVGTCACFTSTKHSLLAGDLSHSWSGKSSPVDSNLLHSWSGKSSPVDNNLLHSWSSKSPPVDSNLSESWSDKSLPVDSNLSDSWSDKSPPIDGDLSHSWSDKSSPVDSNLSHNLSDKSSPVDGNLSHSWSNKSPLVEGELSHSRSDKSPPVDGDLLDSWSGKSPPVESELSHSGSDKSPPVDGDLLDSGSCKSPPVESELSHSGSDKSSPVDGDLLDSWSSKSPPVESELSHSGSDKSPPVDGDLLDSWSGKPLPVEGELSHSGSNKSPPVDGDLLDSWSGKPLPVEGELSHSRSDKSPPVDGDLLDSWSGKSLPFEGELSHSGSDKSPPVDGDLLDSWSGKSLPVDSDLLHRWSNNDLHTPRSEKSSLVDFNLPQPFNKNLFPIDGDNFHSTFYSDSVTAICENSSPIDSSVLSPRLSIDSIQTEHSSPVDIDNPEHWLYSDATPSKVMATPVNIDIPEHWLDSDVTPTKVMERPVDIDCPRTLARQ